MGRVSLVARRRGLRHRPFVLLGLLLLVPALVFGVLGWTSVRRERALAEREAAGEAEDILESRLDVVAAEFASIEAREAERPYFHYQRQYAPAETVFQQLDFQPSPFASAPEDPRVLGWFQWELGAKGVPLHPETFGPQAEELRDDLARFYGGFLRSRLEEAARSTHLMLGRRVDHALRVVQANEERGQLIEEIQIARQQEDAEQAPNAPAATPYLTGFYARVGDEPVPVRYGRFRYAATASSGQSDHELTTPNLVAWRIVWIPAAHVLRREVTRDRWLLQGYALDPGRSLPTSWEKVGVVRLCRADRVPEDVRLEPTAHVASLVDVLGADLVGASIEDPQPDPVLGLVAVPDAEAIDAAYGDARGRFLWLLAGVLVVVAVGFVVLTRGLRREIALARRKEDFVAAVTHELKTPLAGIRMYADMLREGWVADAESADRYATRIIDESDRLGHLVDQVLDLAALERGIARVHAMPGDLAVAVREAAALIAARAEQAGVALVVETEPDLPPVPFDPKLVRPLVLNLLDNAVKYSAHATEKEVRVSVVRDGDHVVVEVADKGVGIEGKARRHLFEPFHRAGDEMTRSAPGVGIGLALVKRYADAHGAKIALESEVGQGTTVRVRFPLS